eukprot:TRINITY_DN38491_c0_g1_i1.p1 TRINITY_DN38491_c0_g1~~TRINITY_DN38491_c0_g1_i1.p1  ORF type:complete len:510 (+),score=116.90 TRINITY_DN38491_c0_g1_i1:189-1532(+)
MAGHAWGPLMGKCPEWDFTLCMGTNCTTATTCHECLSRSMCGWCTPPGGNGTCLPGDASGPLFAKECAPYFFESCEEAQNTETLRFHLPNPDLDPAAPAENRGLQEGEVPAEYVQDQLHKLGERAAQLWGPQPHPARPIHQVGEAYWREGPAPPSQLEPGVEEPVVAYHPQRPHQVVHADWYEPREEPEPKEYPWTQSHPGRGGHHYLHGWVEGREAGVEPPANLMTRVGTGPPEDANPFVPRATEDTAPDVTSEAPSAGTSSLGETPAAAPVPEEPLAGDVPPASQDSVEPNEAVTEEEVQAMQSMKKAAGDMEKAVEGLEAVDTKPPPAIESDESPPAPVDDNERRPHEDEKRVPFGAEPEDVSPQDVERQESTNPPSGMLPSRFDHQTVKTRARRTMGTQAQSEDEEDVSSAPFKWWEADWAGDVPRQHDPNPPPPPSEPEGDA